MVFLHWVPNIERFTVKGISLVGLLMGNRGYRLIVITFLYLFFSFCLLWNNDSPGVELCASCWHSEIETFSMSFEYICRSIGKTIFKNLYCSGLWYFYLKVKINRYSKNFSVAVISYGEFDEYVSLSNCFCSLRCIFSVRFQITFRRRGSCGELRAEAVIPVQNHHPDLWILPVYIFT